MMPMGKPTRLPAFNKPAGPDPMMDQRLYLLRQALADRQLREQERMVGGKMYLPGMGKPKRSRGVPRLPVDQVMKVMR